ncbi:MAG: carbonic anhydrase [Burkholderiales bacterium RIFCSPLOWO2_02_FULL_57_36]|nr:MAG: carbonic anhydrase [Burkholderiales bacterium RIFCSPLOWO2_02_FULL_57_36]
MKTFSLSVLLVGVLLTSGAAYAAGTTHWTYSGEEGPESWARLTPEFGACAGRNQSPINLAGFIEADLKPIKISYRAGGNEILNNGHTVQVNYVAGSNISVDGIQFDLKQFHFHAPSENHINGKSYAMEAHLVHADKDGNLAVVALMFKEGDENKELTKIWPLIPKNAGEKTALPSPFSVAQLLPSSRHYYRFNGSLTTPPCTEGVRWLVMKKPVSASKKQVEAFSHLMRHPNNRPVQPVNARPVLQ